MASLGLGGFRRRAKGIVGYFFVRKKDGWHQRMVVGCRQPNSMHRAPRGSRLGTAAALGRLDMSAATLKAVGADLSSSGEYDPVAFELDLRDCFYQLQARELASWFACEWPEEAATWAMGVFLQYDVPSRSWLSSGGGTAMVLGALKGQIPG